MSKELQRPVAALLSLSFVLAALLSGLGWQQYQQFASDLRWTDHTYQVLDALDNIDHSILKAETSQRNYLLTGDRTYLTRSQIGSSQARKDIEAVSKQTIDNPLQQARIPQLLSLIDRRIQLLQKTSAVGEQHGLLAAQAVIKNGIGIGLMNDIQNLIDLMKQHELGLLHQRQELREASAYKLGILVTCGLLAYLALLLVSYYMIRGALQKRHQAELAAFRARELAEVTLHAIGDGVLITDVHGVITDLNRVAETIIGRSRTQLRGMRVEQALPLFNRLTREPIGNPAYDALRLRQIVMMDPDAALMREDGTEVGIEDSAAPIHDASGNIIGTVLVFRDVTERRNLVDKIASLALYDALTGLANRSLFEDRLRQAIEQAIRSNDKVGLIFMDLDKFKQVNDTLGHAAGDELLKVVSTRLANNLRGVDTACRVGGDEFIALLPGLKNPEDARRVAEKLHAAEQPPAQIEGKDIPIRFSMGIAVYPDDAADSSELMRKADQRMYEHKLQRRAQR